jgi:hypothetical protein
MRSERANVGDHSPALLIFHAGVEGRHFRAGHSVRNHAKEIGIGVASRKGAARQVGTVASAGGMEAVTPRAGHAELHAAQFDGLSVARVGISNWSVLLGEAAACQHENGQEF